MKRINWMRVGGMVVVVAVACLGQGCVSTGEISVTDPAGGVHGGMSNVAEMNGMLSMGVVADGSDAYGKQVAERIKERLVGAVADQGFIVDGKVPDVLLTVDIDVSEFDRSGSYFVYEGDISAGIKRAYDSRVLGQKSVSAKGKRGLGRTKALKNLERELLDPTMKWLNGVDVPTASRLLAKDITISKRIGTFNKEGAGYIPLFIRNVSGISGVFSCRLVEKAGSAKALVFRVVYDRDSIPEGLINAILIIEELKLRRGL